MMRCFSSIIFFLLASSSDAVKNCTLIGESLCNADENCRAFGVFGDQIQLHGCSDAVVPNNDWSIFVHKAGGDYALLNGVNIDEKLCASHPRTGMTHDCAAPAPPTPTPTPPAPLYEKIGAVEVGTYENTLVYWHGALLLLENIPCSYKGHAGEMNPLFGNHSYARLRDFSSGAVLVNVTESIGYGFISAFADYDRDVLWLFGTPADRCEGNGDAKSVQAFWTTDPSLQSWSTALAFDLGKTTYNVQVTRIGPVGGASLEERRAWDARRSLRAPSPLTSARYAMFLECFTWLVNDAPDGNLTHGWSIVTSNAPPGASCGGPSFTYNPVDDYFYILTGGRVVQLFRTLDFLNWTESRLAPFIYPSAGDALIADVNGFSAVSTIKGSPPQKYVNVPEDFPFIPFNPVWMSNWTSWSLNSNDGDFCCQHHDVPDTWIIWGASTQGRAPKPPLTGTDASTNSVATKTGMTLNALLSAYF